MKIAALAFRQHGVVARAQLLRAGVGASLIADWVHAGHLHRLHRGVYAVGHANVSREGRLLAAVLACGPGAVLSHASAARLWRLEREIPGPVHVSIPRGTRRSPAGLLVHRPRALELGHRTVHLGIPVTTVARTVFDQASSMTPAALRRIVEEVGDLDRRRLQALLDGATGRRGLGTLRELLAEGSIPVAETRSGLERIVLRICRDHGLPMPAVNVPLLGYEVDFLWPAARLVVEVDGGHHRGRQRDRDNERDARLVRAGHLVRRYSSAALADHGQVAAEILEILHERLGTGRASG